MARAAELQGELWGAHARDWADQEHQSDSIYSELLRHVRIRTGAMLLDVGCGSGRLCSLAADRGASVSGLDASASLIEIARERVPPGSFAAGDLESLPYGDAAFDVVTLVNSLQFADDPVVALGEARRVARPGGTVAVAVWGGSRVDLRTIVSSLAQLLPPTPSSTGPSLSTLSAVESATAAARLSRRASGRGSCVFDYPDVETATRAILASGAGTRAARAAGVERAREVLRDAFEAFEAPAGGYRLRNDWHYVIATR